MDQKLLEYRAKKEREQFLNNGKEKLKRLFSLNKKQEVAVEKQAAICDEEDLELLSETSEFEEEEPTCCTYIDLIRFVLYFILWATLYAIFIKLQFGIAYFLISSLVIMYINTRTGPRRKGEISAYSVFNKNCKSIDGTLKAEQLERELYLR